MVQRVFEVEITRRETATLLVLGESEGEVEETLRRDVENNENSYYFGDAPETDVSAWELKLKPGDPKWKEVEWGVIAGEVYEMDEYADKLETTPVRDTVTLPLPYVMDDSEDLTNGPEKKTGGFEHLQHTIKRI